MPVRPARLAGNGSSGRLWTALDGFWGRPCDLTGAFRRDCLRELKKIKDAWPDLHYRTVKGALLLSPTPPRIAPSQLRLVE